MNKKVNFNNYKIICCDLDGVIVDSIINMENAWLKTCKKNNINIPFYRYKKYLGLPFKNILINLNIKKNHNKIQKDYNYFSTLLIGQIKVYPFIKKIVKTIKEKFIFCIITSKNKSRALKCLNNNNIPFDLLLCPSKKIRGKPKIDSINYISRKFNVKKNKIIYIGDTYNDLIFAKKCNIDFIHAKWGYESKLASKSYIKTTKDFLSYL